MADSNYVVGDQVYPDETTAVVATHPDIPDEIKRLYVSPQKPTEGSGDVQTAPATTLPPSENNAPAASVEAPMGTLKDTYLKALTGTTNPPSLMDALYGFYDSVKKAFSLPGEVYAGNIDPMSEQGIERAADLAGFMVGGPAPVAAKMADGTLGSFAGVRSATLPQEALDLAKTAEAQGLHADDIYKGTGFFKGADNQWRYEIDDSGSTFNPDKMRDFLQPLDKVLDHQDLYEAYPWAKDLGVRIDVNRNPTSAAYYGQGPGKGYILMGTEAAQNQGTLMHEVQHAIQDYEGHNQGGAPLKPQDYQLKYQKQVDALRSEWFQMQDRMLKNAEKNRYDYIKQVLQKYNEYSEAGRKQALENYLRLAGETEARNVDTRLLMTPSERAASNPISTEDVQPRENQLVTDYPVGTTPYTHQALAEGHNPLGPRVSPQSADVTQFRRAANDNDIPIKGPSLEELQARSETSSRQAAWDNYRVEQFQKYEDEFDKVYSKYPEGSTTKDMSELDAARVNKLNAEWESIWNTIDPPDHFKPKK